MSRGLGIEWLGSVPYGEALELQEKRVEARLSELLRAEYGRRFWKRRPAGDLLKELWNTGTTLTAETLSGELGLGELSVDGWIELALRA